MAGKKTTKTSKAKPRTNKGKNGKNNGKKGDRFVCGECGFSLCIDEPCGCDSEYSLMCCDEPMSWERC